MARVKKTESPKAPKEKEPRKRGHVNWMIRPMSEVATFEIIPLYEALIVFFLATAARRGEGLALLWAHTNLLERTAFFLRPRTAPQGSPLCGHISSICSASC